MPALLETQDRTKIIGGSDIAAIMGLNPWKSAFQLWLEKTGKVEPPDLSDVERVEIGSELEEFVARKFERKTGLKLRRDNRTFKHPVHEYMAGHIDRMVLDGESIFEAKTTSAWMEKEWINEDIPQAYVLQLMWYMGLAKRDRGFIAVLIGGQKFVWKEIRFDGELFQKMVECAKVFWEQFVLADIPPQATWQDNETIGDFYPNALQKNMIFDDSQSREINMLLEKKLELAQDLKMLERESSEVDARLKQNLGKNESGETDKYRFSWKSQSRKYVDSDLLKKDGLYEKYQKVSSFRVLLPPRKKLNLEEVTK